MFEKKIECDIEEVGGDRFVDLTKAKNIIADIIKEKIDDLDDLVWGDGILLKINLNNARSLYNLINEDGIKYYKVQFNFDEKFIMLKFRLENFVEIHPNVKNLLEKWLKKEEKRKIVDRSKKIFRVWMRERHLKTNDWGGFFWFIQLDNVGFIYEMDVIDLKNTWNFTPDFFRHILSWSKDAYCQIIANDKESAKEEIRKTHIGLYIGGNESPLQKAQGFIDKIEEIPICKELHINKDGEFICGEEMQSGNGEWGMCTLEGYDMPSFCPLKWNSENDKWFITEGIAEND